MVAVAPVSPIRAVLTVAALLGVAIAVSGCPTQERAADARFRALYSAEWKWREEQFADDEDSQRPIADHLPRVDAAAQEARLKYWEDLLGRLDTIPREQLSPQERTDITKMETALRAVMQEDDYQAIRSAIDVLNQGTMHLAEMMMDSAVSSALKGKDMATADVGEGPASPHPIAQAEIK